ncbi:MAG TPA: HdeD family acid-resistance protein [Streptosporangiaceae bacterium]|nr:HdeD family acid-resistance protein [Streptosporangiaceae bacterium]
MTSNTTLSRSPLREAMRGGAREISGYWGWFLVLGILWTLLGMYVLSYRVGSLAAVAGLVGVAFLFGGITQLVVASRVRSWRWLYIVSGILGVAAGILTFVWPGLTLYIVSILVAWYLIIFGIVNLISAIAGPKLGWWWTGLLLGIAELVLGVWAVRSSERSLVTLVTLVGVWAIFHGVNEIFAAFTLREVGERAERLAADATR